VDRRIRFIQTELDSLNKALQSALDLAGQWQQNEQRGQDPAVPDASIRTMKLYVRGMRRNLDTIDGILDGTDD
jgi:hypothetical protein